ncbi:MAG: membrane protein insertase YidC [Chloroflexi bacterium]|nr:membrane protein insertase YidC [Chloroflexota bacterium]
MDIGGLWQSFVNLLVWALVYLHGALFSSYGLSIIALTLTVRIIMLPLMVIQLRSTRAMQQIGPEIQELKKKYAKQPDVVAREQMRIYRERGVNPMTGCLPMLIQMPVWFALYQALFKLANDSEEFRGAFLWIHSLAAPEGLPWILGILLAASQFVTQKMAMPRVADPQQQTMNRMMLFTMPGMFLFLDFTLPSGLMLYWLTSNLFQFALQYFTTGWGSLFPERPALGEPAAAPSEPLIPLIPFLGSRGKSAAQPAGDSPTKDGIRVYYLEPDGAERGTPSPDHAWQKALVSGGRRTRTRRRGERRRR